MTSGLSSRLSRRGLLAVLGGGIAATGAFAAPGRKLDWTRAGGALGNRRQQIALARADARAWTAYVGSEFQMGGTTARLAAVEPLPSPGARPAGLRDRAFALVFESRSGALPVPDRIHSLSHADAGAMQVYFSACGEACSGRRLRAVFN
jgi:hypothetical protein